MDSHPLPQRPAVVVADVKCLLNQLSRRSDKWRSMEVQGQYQCKSFLRELPRQCMHPSMQTYDVAPTRTENMIYNCINPSPVVYKNI